MIGEGAIVAAIVGGIGIGFFGWAVWRVPAPRLTLGLFVVFIFTAGLQQTSRVLGGAEFDGVMLRLLIVRSLTLVAAFVTATLLNRWRPW